MNLNEANVIFRKAIVKGYFEPELINRGYTHSAKHPHTHEEGFTCNSFLHLYFDLQTGSDYPDGDEWFMIEYLFPYDIQLPDKIKGLDYFTTLSLDDGKNFWRHRELVRYKYGKSKKIEEALNFIDRKYKELSEALDSSSVTKGLS